MGLPEVADWPEMVAIFDQAIEHPHQVWEWPLFAGQAVGGDLADFASPCAAVLCMMLGISLIDDLLDEDPRGIYRQIGAGATANIAFAFQAAATRLMAQTMGTIEHGSKLMDSFSHLALATAFGQYLDVGNPGGEQNYWKVILAKSGPFYQVALHIGALWGNASVEVAEQIRDFGLITGEVVQLHDDMKDALQSPANPDWKHGRNNLLILYALTTKHPRREQFEALLEHVDNPSALHIAQEILIRCGAVSYCAYQIVRRYKAARELLDRIPLADPTPLRNVLIQQVRPIVILLQNLRVELPPELIL